MQKRRGWQLANVASLAADIAAWERIRRTGKAGLPWRLPLTIVDETLWTAYSPGAPVVASLSSVALAIETTLRWGLVGALAPATSSALAAVLRRRRAQTVGGAELVWPALGAGAGLTFRWMHHRRLGDVARAHEQELPARRTAAYLAGQNSVAMGADSVVDALAGVAPVLRGTAAPAALEQLADAWKTSLAANTRAYAVYLGSELTKWAQLRNLHPDLQAGVDLVITEGDGTTLLTGAQAAALVRKLDSMRLVGAVRVRVAQDDYGRRPLGAPLRLMINEQPVDLPADTRSRPACYDIGPALFAVGAGWALVPTSRTYEHVPLRWLIGPAVGSALAAVWAAGLVRQRGGGAHGRFLRVAALLSGTTSYLACRHARNDYNIVEGKPTMPAVCALYLLATMSGSYWDELSTAQRSLVGATSAAIFAVGWSVLPHRQPIWNYRNDLLLLPGMLLATRNVGRAVDEDAEVLRRTLEEQDRQIIATEFRNGRSFVIELVARAYKEAWQAFDTCQYHLDITMRATVRRRLLDIGRRLASITNHDQFEDRRAPGRSAAQ